MICSGETTISSLNPATNMPLYQIVERDSQKTEDVSIQFIDDKYLPQGFHEFVTFGALAPTSH